MPLILIKSGPEEVAIQTENIKTVKTNIAGVTTIHFMDGDYITTTKSCSSLIIQEQEALKSKLP